MATDIGIVKTTYGKVSGVPLADPYRGITQFRGIPYAAPPVGDLRWRPPVDPPRWDDVRVCDTYGPAAMQNFTTFEPNYSDFYYRGHPSMSEDCLYLNVTTGATQPGEKRPVYIWFHGGGLFNGYSYIYIFDPSELARKGVVVVSVGHRLNIFGYLSLPQLSAEQGGKSGNYGLMDEFKALDWVRENIAAFGGDPDNITVGGQSGGTWKSGALATSPHTRGRVRRVINQSDLFWLRNYPTMEEAADGASTYLTSIGVDPHASPAQLRALDAATLLGPPGAIGRFPSTMVWDGDYIQHREQPRNYLAYGTALDYLTGTNYGEGTLRGGVFFAEPFTDVEDFYNHMRTFLGDLYDTYDFPALYPVDAENLDHRSRWLASYGMAGMGGVMLNRYFGAWRQASGHSGRTYAYRFARIAPWRPEDRGTARDPDKLLAYHSSEMWYTFASFRPGVPPVRPWQALDFELADTISSYWANFIHRGDPNGPGLPSWPASDAAFGYVHLGDEITGHSGIDGPLEQMILAYLRRRGDTPPLPES